jgi:hypothetical protein
MGEVMAIKIGGHDIDASLMHPYVVDRHNARMAQPGQAARLLHETLHLRGWSVGPEATYLDRYPAIQLRVFAEVYGAETARTERFDDSVTSERRWQNGRAGGRFLPDGRCRCRSAYGRHTARSENCRFIVGTKRVGCIRRPREASSSPCWLSFQSKLTGRTAGDVYFNALHLSRRHLLRHQPLQIGIGWTFANHTVLLLLPNGTVARVCILKFMLLKARSLFADAMRKIERVVGGLCRSVNEGTPFQLGKG